MESSKLVEDGSTRAAIVAALADQAEDAAGLSAADLSALVGVHVTTVRFHLDRLAKAGVVVSRLAPERGVGRPGRRYTLADVPDPGAHQGRPAASDDEHFKLLAGLLSESFRRSPDGAQPSPEEVGERWAAQHVSEILGRSEDDVGPARTPGEWLSKVGTVVDLLQAWGYDPVMSTEDGGASALLRLRDCPFLELARADPDVICGTHLGLVRGALDYLGEPDSEVVLEPFTDPPLCLVQLVRHPSDNPGRTA